VRRLAPHAVSLALALGVFGSLLPLLQTRVLPFHDSAGIVGLGGALALRHDPAAAVAAFYDVDVRAYPSALYFGWAWLAGALGVPVELAFSVFIALFCVAALPLSLLLLLRAFGRPPALALLAFPVSYHHQIWYGFLGSSAAVPGLLCALAFARRLIDRPSAGNHLGLAAALLFLAMAHPFPLALALAVVAPALLAPPGGWGRGGLRPGARGLALHYATRAGALVPMVVFLASWAAGFFGRDQPTASRSLWRSLRSAAHRVGLQAPTRGHAGEFLSWLGNGYLSGWDEVVPALALGTLALVLVLGLRPPPALPGLTLPPARLGERQNTLLLVWAAAVLLLGFLVLPLQLVWPELWWGVRVRCVLPAYLVLVALVRPRPRGLPPWVLAPAYAAALVFFGYVTADFRGYFRGRVLAGFDQALAAIPAGQSVLGFPVRPDPHYTLAHPYLVQHYVARKGGRAVPHLKGHPGSYWITMKPPPASPPWGAPQLFDFAEHGQWDYFLLERPLDGPAPEPMRTAPPGAVSRVLAAGQWELWRRSSEAQR
jgi:hypothetical protein